MSDNNQRILAAQIAANESWARCPDRAARTAEARKKAWDRFEDQVDPNRELPPKERAKRAENARKAYFLRLALKSANARKARKAAEARQVAVAERLAELDAGAAGATAS